MKLLRSFPAMVFVLVLMSIIALCAAQESLQLLLVAGTLAAVSWYITEGPRGRTLPRWVSNLLVMGVTLNLFVDFLQHRQDPMGVLGRFEVWLTLIKLYERKTARDHAQLMLLSLLLMITGSLQAPADFRMGIALLIYSVLGLYVLLLYQLHAAYERHHDARSGAIPQGYRLVPPLRPIVGRRAEMHFRSQAAGIGAVGAMLSVAAFVGMPRGFGADFLGGVPAQSRNRQTQFVNQVDLLTGGRINENHSRAMTVQLTDQAGRAIKLDHPLLLRGGVCNAYEGKGRWRPASGTRSRPIAITPSDVVALSQGPGDPAASGTNPQHFITQHITNVRSGSNIFAMYAPTAMAAQSSAAVLYDPASQILRCDAGSSLLDYSIRVQPEPDDDVLPTLVDRINQGIPPNGRFPDPDGRVHDLAEGILSKIGIPLQQDSGRIAWRDWDAYRAAANAFLQHLQSAEYQYTLDLSEIQASGEPITQFLIDTRRGHCEFFASGMAALCHTVGIPARLVTGYIAYEYDDADQQYVVYESNAHAWVEVLTGQYRWTTFDPTPPSAYVEHHDEETLADSMRTIYQRIEGNWSASIVDFDSSAQDRLAESLNFGWSKRLGDGLQAVRDWMERVNIFFNVGPGGYIWMGIVALVLVIAIVALVKLMRRSLAIRRAANLQHVHGAEYQRLLRQLGFYIDMLRVLKRGGIAKPDWQPPLAFAHALAKRRPDAAAPIDELTRLFYAARYGGHRLDRDQQQHAHKLVEQLAATLKVRL